MAALHVIPSFLLMALLGLQLSGKMRYRFPRFHRYTGRIWLLAAILITLSGVYFALAMPFGGLAETEVTLFISAVFMFYFGMGVLEIRRKNITRHRQVMR